MSQALTGEGGGGGDQQTAPGEGTNHLNLKDTCTHVHVHSRFTKPTAEERVPQCPRAKSNPSAYPSYLSRNPRMTSLEG
jgi:hypothetical protein